MSQPVLLHVTDLSKRYGDVAVFENISLQVARGEFVAIVGESGVGKSTLLNCIAGLDTWDSGQILLDGIDLSGLTDDQRALLRRDRVGFVFQAFHVLPHLTVAQNVALPLMLQSMGSVKTQAKTGAQAPMQAQVEAQLQVLGLGGLGQRLPAQLSGGQLQRVSIARALVHRPALILADEPTGNLDAKTATLVMAALVEQTRSAGAALVLVTHAANAIIKADRVLKLSINRLVE